MAKSRYSFVSWHTSTTSWATSVAIMFVIEDESIIWISLTRRLKCQVDKGCIMPVSGCPKINFAICEWQQMNVTLWWPRAAVKSTEFWWASIDEVLVRVGSLIIGQLSYILRGDYGNVFAVSFVICDPRNNIDWHSMCLNCFAVDWYLPVAIWEICNCAISVAFIMLWWLRYVSQPDLNDRLS